MRLVKSTTAYGHRRRTGRGGCEQSYLISPFLVEAFKIFALDRVHSLLCTFQLVFLKVVFRTFPKHERKVRSWVRTRVRGCPPVSAHPRQLLGTRIRLLEWVMILTDQGLTFGTKTRGRHAGRWRMATCLAGGCGLTATLLIFVIDVWTCLWVLVSGGWNAAAHSRWCRLCVGAACQLWRLLEEIPLRCLPRRAVCTWKTGLCLCPRIFQSFWCMGVACGVRRVGFSGRVRCLVQQWMHVLREALDEFQHFLLCGELES